MSNTVIEQLLVIIDELRATEAVTDWVDSDEIITVAGAAELSVCCRLAKLGIPSRPALEFSREHLCIVSSDGARYRVLDVLASGTGTHAMAMSKEESSKRAPRLGPFLIRACTHKRPLCLLFGADRISLCGSGKGK
jgi:hypothetical protein